MKALLVQNGDIVLDTSGRLSFVQGSSKLTQDLGLWLQEAIGTGFTTPNFGSLLPGLVGSSYNQSNILAVQAEIQRVITLYQNQQVQALQQAQNLSQLSNWNKSEIINTLNYVQMQQSTTSLIATVSITTLAGTDITLTVYISEQGVQVQNGS